MRIRTRIGTGKAVHAAEYNENTGEIKVLCGQLKYKTYYAAVQDPQPPTLENITCSRCKKKF